MTRDVLGPSPKTLSRFSGRGWPRLGGGEAGRGLYASAHSASSVALLVLTLLLSLAPATSANAQTPSPSDVLTAFRTTDSYIRNWSVPQAPISRDADPKQHPRAVGVCITLKLRGEIIARSAAWSATIAGPDAPDPDLIRQAALAAIQQAEPKLGVPNDAFRDEAIKQVVKDIAISLELAGPLSTVEFDTWDQAELSLRPGLDGVAARVQGASRVSERNTAPPLIATFPSQMLLTNTLPHRALGGAVSKALGEGGAAAALDEPKKLREQSGVRMYRFRVAHAAQAIAGISPELLYRGAALAPPGQGLSLQQLRGMADLCAVRLANVYPRGDPYHPRPLNTSSAEALLARLALSRYFQTCGMGVVDPQSLAATPSSNDVVPAANDVDPVVLSLRFLGVHDHWLGMGKPKFIDPQDVMLKNCFPRLAKLVDTDGRFAPAVPPTAKGLVALALVARAEGVHDEGLFRKWSKGEKDESLQAAVSAVRSTATSGAGGTLVAQMPWAGMAELRLVRLNHRIDPSLPETIPSALALRRMRDQVWQHQLSATDVNEDTLDMAGGIVFRVPRVSEPGAGRTPEETRLGEPGYPTWQCVRPLAFIATMLGDERLTEPAERPREIARLMQAMRYLRQLQVDDAASWMYPDPALAKGGIRAAVWDNSLPIDATSLTLLTVVELLKSLDALSKPAAPIQPTKDVTDEPRTK